MEVRYDETLTEALASNIKKISLIIIAFGSLLFFIMMALINNTIRLTMYAKRFLIKSMQLVGATRGFIRKPFVIRGILNGIYGAIIANLLLVLLLYFTQKHFTDLFGLQDVTFMLTLFTIVLITGVLISGISTWFAVNRYLRKSFDELF
jgi:cell division transport system permease protein